MKTRKLLFQFALFLFLAFAGQDAVAQCSMCRQGASSSIESGEKRGRGLNTGILYLMAVPYAMGGVAGVIWWKYRKSNQPAD